MATIPFRPGSRASLLALLLLAPARAQDDRPRVVVPSGPAAAVDGAVGAEEWEGAAELDVRRGKDVVARARMRRHGRQLLVAYESSIPAQGTGIRFNFVDPVTKRANPVLVVPLDAGHAPVRLFRVLSGRGAEVVSAATSDFRFANRSQEGFAFELRVPLDTLEVPRASRPYLFSVEVWDLEADRALAFFPYVAKELGGPQVMARLEPEGDWGKDLPRTAEPPATNEAIALLEKIARERAGAREGAEAPPAVLHAYTGWADGKRRDTPLAELESSLEDLAGRYPGYLALRAALVQTRMARNDAAGALDALEGIARDFPLVSSGEWHVFMRVQLLRLRGRHDEALEFLRGNRERIGDEAAFRVEERRLAYLAAAARMEERIRAEEADRDDLPRARLTIEGKGDFVVELFEDDAPNGVANFVSLVERGFYDGLRFHWAEGGRRVIGGDPNSKDDDPANDGYGDAGYEIESEPGRRLHLPFTVSFSDKRRTRRSESCAFAIHFAPFPLSDGVNTVFGRIVEGFDVVRGIEHGDVIERARMVRKRDHVYEPEKRP